MLTCTLSNAISAYASADGMSNANSPCIITKLGSTISNTGSCMGVDLNHTDNEYYMNLADNNMITCYVSGSSQSDYNATATGNDCINAGISINNPLNAPMPPADDNDAVNPGANTHDDNDADGNSDSDKNNTGDDADATKNSSVDKEKTDSETGSTINNDANSGSGNGNRSSDDNEPSKSSNDANDSKKNTSKKGNTHNDSSHVSKDDDMTELGIMIAGYCLLSIFG